MTAAWIDRKPRNNAEDQLQKAVVEHLRIRADKRVIWMHIPNSPRSKIAGARLKAMGMLAGAPDLMFVLPDGTAAFMELKRPAANGVRAGRAAPTQEAFAARCEAIGVPYAIIWTIDTALEVLIAWGILPPEL